MKEKLLKIIEHYGVNNQQRKLMEEIFELQEAITQKEYPAIAKGHKNEQLDELEKKHIEEEFADVMVLLEQLKEYYNLNDFTISVFMKSKIDRQLERIKNEK